MKNKLIKPNWFPLTIYTKKLTAKDWLDSIDARVNLILCIHNQHITKDIAKKRFIEIIVENKRKSILDNLIVSSHQPISPMPAFEILYIAKLIFNSDWFKTHKHRNEIEKIIDALGNGQTLTENQRLILQKFRQEPWNAFQEEEKNTGFKYINATPMSIDFSFEYKSLQSSLQKHRKSYVEQNNINKKPRSIPDIFPEWEEKQILAIFDLLVWYDINEINLKNHKNELVSTIWPILPLSDKTKNPYNPIELLEMATELSTKAITQATVRALIMHCENEAYQNQ